ncbi:MAG: hypothetical protein ABSH20_32085 [Tepidisphaeraceae bacterium]|jgi:hypothetical protein
MTSRGNPAISGRDQTPWSPGRLPGPREPDLAQRHVVERTSAGYRCEACDFASQDPAEVAAHIVGNQFGLAAGRLRADGRPPTDDVA